MDNIFVIIVTYNAMKWIDKCIESVLSSNIPLKTIIVDNCSHDGTVNHIHKMYNSVILIENTTNIGFGQANNQGLEYALKNHCDYVYLLNQDAYLEPDTIYNLVKILKGNPDYGLISPLQLISTKDKLDSNFAKYCSNISCPGLLDDSLLRKPLKQVYPIDFVMAAHWLISRKCLLKVGGFNPVFPHYGEDDNFLHRMKFHNFKYGISPYAQAIHDRDTRVSTKKNIMYMNYIEYIKINSNITLVKTDKAKKNLRNFITTIRMCYSYISFSPIIYLCRFFFSMNKIHRANKIAMKKQHPFLEL